MWLTFFFENPGVETSKYACIPKKNPSTQAIIKPQTTWRSCFWRTTRQKARQTQRPRQLQFKEHQWAACDVAPGCGKIQCTTRLMTPTLLLLIDTKYPRSSFNLPRRTIPGVRVWRVVKAHRTDRHPSEEETKRTARQVKWRKTQRKINRAEKVQRRNCTEC